MPVRNLSMFLLVSLLFYTCVCDRVFNYDIYNSTKDSIVFQTILRKDLLDRTYYSRNYTNLLQNEIESHSGISVIKMDTNNLSIEYKVPPQVTFTFQHAMNGPNFEYIIKN